jgi:hypothetical protein
MPYIKPQDRDRPEPTTTDVGHLTFLFYRLALDALPATPRYADLHAVLGAMEAAKLEFYRRVVSPYEDAKIAENGDVLGSHETPRQGS